MECVKTVRVDERQKVACVSNLRECCWGTEERKQRWPWCSRGWKAQRAERSRAAVVPSSWWEFGFVPPAAGFPPAAGAGTSAFPELDIKAHTHTKLIHQDLTAKYKWLKTTEMKQWTQYHKPENYTGTRVGQDLRKNYNDRLPLSEDTALIGGQQPRDKCKPDAVQQNRTTGLVSAVNRNTTVLPLPAVCVCQTSPRRQKALYHNRNSCCSFTQLWHYKPTRCYWKIRYYFYLADRETTQVTHRQNTGNEAHNYCGINQCINYPHYRDECNYRLQAGIFDWHAVK